MKKISFLMLLTMAFLTITVSLAAAGTNQLTLRNSAGQVISSADFNSRSMSYNGDCLQMRTYGGKTDIAIAMSSSFYQEGAKDNTVDRPDWSDVEMGLGVNFYDGNKPVLKKYKTAPVLGSASGDNEDVILWTGLDLPLDGSVIALTLPARFKQGGQVIGSWRQPNSHPWGWISWYNSACGRFGDGQIAYLVRYINGRWEASGIASPPDAKDAVPMSNRN